MEEHKIGITTKMNVQSRLQGEGHKFKIIKIYKNTLFKCFKLEQLILKKLNRFKANKITAKDLDGHSEVFDLSDKNLLNTIKKL